MTLSVEVEAPLLLVEKKRKLWYLTINRPAQRNSITPELLVQLNAALDEAEQDSVCRILVLSGSGGYFCTGMDFDTAADKVDSQDTDNLDYMDTLKRFATMRKIVIARVQGVVMAGGVGLVAASDIVIADQDSRFSLSEALWGLIPACVTPFLIRRVGFQKAYKMTMTTETLDAAEATAIGLVDILSQGNGDDEIRRQLLRLDRVTEQTIGDIKSYFRKMWLFDEAMEQTAVNEFKRLVATPQVQQNISNYSQHGRMPWQATP